MNVFIEKTPRVLLTTDKPLYLWPHGGSTRFQFKFRPRHGLNALTAPSQLYDYYNPEARTVVPPTRFVVR